MFILFHTICFLASGTAGAFAPTNRGPVRLPNFRELQQGTNNTQQQGICGVAVGQQRDGIASNQHLQQQQQQQQQQRNRAFGVGIGGARNNDDEFREAQLMIDENTTSRFGHFACTDYLSCVYFMCVRVRVRVCVHCYSHFAFFRCSFVGTDQRAWMNPVL